MTLGLGILLFGSLLVYCGVESKSVRQALLGHAVTATSGSLISTSGTFGSSGTTGSSSPAMSAGSNAAGTTIIAPPTGG